MPLCGDADEPEFEDVREDQQDPTRFGEFKGYEADRPEQIQRDGDGSCGAVPLPNRHPEEGQHVDLVDPFVEGLVIADAAQLDQVHHEEIRKIDEYRDDRSDECPAEHGQRTGDPCRCDYELFEGHVCHGILTVGWRLGLTFGRLGQR